MKRIILVLIVLAVMALPYGACAQQAATHDAYALLKDANGRETGTATFTEDSSGVVHIDVRASGLSPGLHGIHVHEKGNCSPPFASAGAHFNPLGKHHGLKNPDGPHAGDLPDLQVNADGVGYLNTTTDRFTLSPGPTTVFDSDGSSLVIHSGPDDQMTDPAGNSGDRVACGVIVPGRPGVKK